MLGAFFHTRIPQLVLCCEKIITSAQNCEKNNEIKVAMGGLIYRLDPGRWISQIKYG